MTYPTIAQSAPISNARTLQAIEETRAAYDTPIVAASDHNQIIFEAGARSAIRTLLLKLERHE